MPPSAWRWPNVSIYSADKSHLVIMAQAFLELAEKRDKLEIPNLSEMRKGPGEE